MQDDGFAKLPFGDIHADMVTRKVTLLVLSMTRQSVSRYAEVEREIVAKHRLPNSNTATRDVPALGSGVLDATR